MLNNKNRLSVNNLGLASLLMMLIGFPALANDTQQQVANEMAHALVANECGQTRQPPMTAGYQSGLLMSMKRTGLAEDEVAKILNQSQTMQMSEIFSKEIKNQIDEGITTCNDIYSYVVSGMIPER